MHEMILCKLGEVVLKGLNRRSFEDKLMANVNRRVAKCGNFRIYAKQSTIYVEPKDENCDIEAAFEGCKKVFGIIAVSKALPCEKDVQKIIGAAKEKVLSLAKLLVPWCGRMTVQVVPFTEIQEEIRRNCPEEFFTLIMRRFMMRISQRVAEQVKAKALVTGENLGQVASQTMDAMAVTGAVCELPVFRPCIGMDKEEIVRIARKIDTFETSILPYEDCCTVFTPKHPNTKPKMPKILEAESHLDVDTLVDEAVKGVEIVHLP